MKANYHAFALLFFFITFDFAAPMTIFVYWIVISIECPPSIGMPIELQTE